MGPRTTPISHRAAAALVASLVCTPWACTLSFPDANTPGRFACADDRDCLSGVACVGGWCGGYAALPAGADGSTSGSGDGDGDGESGGDSTPTEGPNPPGPSCTDVGSIDSCGSEQLCCGSQPRCATCPSGTALGVCAEERCALLSCAEGYAKVGDTCWSWSSQSLNDADDVHRFAALGLDSAGRPHLAYQRDNTDDLYYVAQGPGGWSTPVPIAIDGVTGEAVALAMWGDLARLVFWDATLEKLHYAEQQAGGGFSVTPLETISGGLRLDLALDAQGTPHLSYYDATTQTLSYATRDGGTWSSETVSDATIDGTSIALDSDGMPRIAYHDATERSVRLASRSGGAWSSRLVESTGNGNHPVALHLDADDTPHIAYFAEGGMKLHYAVLANNVWTKEVVEPGDVTSYRPDYDVGITQAGGDLIVTYFRAGWWESEGLMLAVRQGPNTWSRHYVDQRGDSGRYLSLAVSSAGVPWIAYGLTDATGQLALSQRVTP